MTSLADYETRYKELAAKLRKEKWFKKSWQVKTGFYPDAKTAKSVYIQLFRDSWFNADGKGIHFESWMTNADVARGTAPVVLHIESSKERTGINGKTFVKELFAAEGRTISAWEGYQTKESYTMQPFIKKASVTLDSHVETLRAEFVRMVEIADAIDGAIDKARE